jgi:hypothetical protein
MLGSMHDPACNIFPVRGALCALLMSALIADAAAADDARWSFVATLRTLDEIELRACSASPADQVRFVSGDDAASDFVLESVRDSSKAVARARGELIAQDWQAGECLVTRVDLQAAARTRQPRLALQGQQWQVVDPRRWLWRPRRLGPDSRIRFELPPRWSASVPWPATGDAPWTYRLGSSMPGWPARTAFGHFDVRSIERAGGAMHVALLPPWTRADLERIEPVADALQQAIGRLPRAQVQVLIVPLPGERRAAPWGEVMRGGASAVHLFVGADAPTDALIEDWTATHEFSHLLHPYLGGSGRWLSEGLASYYQNVLRARVGVLSADEAWQRLEAGFGRGRADTRSTGAALSDASRGLDRTHAFMRVYWSGAAFWLEADLALRARGSSLDAVLARYADCCLESAGPTDADAFVAALDRLAGGEIFATSYRRFAALRTFPDITIPAHDDPRRAAIMQRRTPDIAVPR